MIFYQEPNSTLYCDHALTELKLLPDESVDMCMTSPPYWGLRSYKTEPMIWEGNSLSQVCARRGEHEWNEVPQKISRWAKALATDCKQATEGGTLAMVPQGDFCLKCNAWRGELGLEPTIELYIEHLILIFNEVKRVLKKTGTCWVNIDDSYAGGGRASGQSREQVTEKQATNFESAHINIKIDYPAKSLCLIPQRFAIAMVESGWILRNDIVWNKPNPMPESVKDRFTGSWEHLFFFVKSKRYWFEQQFEAHESPLITKRTWGHKYDGYNNTRQNRSTDAGIMNELGRNKHDVWEITTQPYPEAHFATFPEKLCETPILAGCPGQICKKCGKAREKIYENEQYSLRPKSRPVGDARGKSVSDFRAIGQPQQGCQCVSSKVVGYTDCGCNASFESGVVLDPFMGSGTTLAVAKRLGRKGIGIDISPDYCNLAVKRLQGIPLPMELSV